MLLHLMRILQHSFVTYVGNVDTYDSCLETFVTYVSTDESFVEYDATDDLSVTTTFLFDRE